MGKMKNVLAYTNPITLIAGIPVFVGFILAAMFDGVAKKTKHITKEFNEDL